MGKKKKEDVQVAPDHIIRMDVYNIDIAVFFSTEGADLYFHKEWGQESDYYKKQFAGSTHAMTFLFEPENGGLIHGVIFPNMPTPGVLAHECMHLIDMIADSIGMPCTMDTTEPRAYMMQYLYGELLTCLHQWGKENPKWLKSS